ncbi:class I glutamine amidotransferase-like protein [Earliella scabrosa]|nr:class I glutamine amidotransferase-like protein [Earliella scabrosa]
MSKQTGEPVSESGLPTKFGVLVFPGFEPLDVFGPIEALQMLSQSHKVDLYMISPTLDPVSTAVPEEHNTTSSNIGVHVVPTHTFDTVPDDLEVLLVPGGIGTRTGNYPALAQFIKEIYPKLKYLITVCTGSALAADAGVLDGKRATSNKARFKATSARGPNVQWVKTARYVVDGNCWTSAGVSAGIDVTLAWIASVYGTEVARGAANRMEYEWKDDRSWDPFSYVFGEGV